jgi:hypothetical protein
LHQVVPQGFPAWAVGIWSDIDERTSYRFQPTTPGTVPTRHVAQVSRYHGKAARATLLPPKAAPPSPSPLLAGRRLHGFGSFRMLCLIPLAW